jgi:hypothetical protein
MPWGAAGKTDSVTEDTVPLPYCIRGVGILFDNVLTFGPKRLLLVLPVLLEFDHLHLGHHPDDRLSTSTFTISHHRDSTSCRHLAAQQMLKACFHLDSSYIEWTEISLQLRKIHRCNILWKKVHIVSTVYITNCTYSIQFYLLYSGTWQKHDN